MCWLFENFFITEDEIKETLAFGLWMLTMLNDIVEAIKGFKKLLDTENFTLQIMLAVQGILAVLFPKAGFNVKEILDNAIQSIYYGKKWSQ